MEFDIENLPKSQEELKNIILHLHQSLHQNKVEFAAYKEKYAHLLEEIRLAKQRRFAPSSEKNSLQPDMFDEAGVDLPEEVKEQLHDEIEVKSYTRKKHPVRRPLPDYLPREVVVHDISETDKVCCCGAHLVRIGEEISEQLKYIPAQISVIHHDKPTYMIYYGYLGPLHLRPVL